MYNGYISEEEFKSYLLRIIEMIKEDSPREEVMNYLEELIYEHSKMKDKSSKSVDQNNKQHRDNDKKTALGLIKSILEEYGFDGEIRHDRKGGSYVNIGDVKRLRLRAQFWVMENSQEIHFWAGKEMGYWYTLSMQSMYRVPWDALSDKENKLVFPDIDSAIDYIKKVAKSTGNI